MEGAIKHECQLNADRRRNGTGCPDSGTIDRTRRHGYVDRNLVGFPADHHLAGGAGGTAGVCCAWRFNCCSIRRTWRRSVLFSSGSRSRHSCCEAVGSTSRRSQARPSLVQNLGRFGGITLALRNRARTAFLARVGLAITWLRKLTNASTYGSVGALARQRPRDTHAAAPKTAAQI
jgi:hypothetical protein